MKPILNLSIPKPCSEKWENFTPTSQGGFCGSCNGVVTDFTKMSDQEIVDFLDAHPVHICGRLRADQMKEYGNWQPAKINPGLALLRSGLVCLFFALTSHQSFAQTPQTQIETVPSRAEASNVALNEIVVKGVVTDETGSPMPGVSVYLKNGSEGTITDVDGKFEFPTKLAEGDRLTFSFVGYESMEHIIRKNDEGPITLMELKMTLDVAIMGEVVVGKVYTTKTGIRRWWSGVKNIF
jgi:hypothetical protein